MPPVARLGDRRRLGRDALLAGASLVQGLRPLGAALRPALRDTGLDRVQALGQRREVTDGMRFDQRLTEPADPARGLVGRGRPGSEALFEQVYLNRKVVVLAPEERECLLGFTDLPGPDLALAVVRTDEDGAGSVDAPPCVLRHRGRRCQLRGSGVRAGGGVHLWPFVPCVAVGGHAPVTRTSSPAVTCPKTVYSGGSSESS